MDVPADAARYLPRVSRAGAGLALSGGGFRATLFHLGALRRLNEYGLLAGLDTIVGVSGGSIALAALAVGWPPPPASSGGRAAETGAGRGGADAAAPAPIADFDRRIAQPLRDFTARNIRSGPLFRAFLPWNLLRGRSNTDLLAAQYRRLTLGRQLPSLPVRPRFYFAATDLAFGVDWRFERDRIGDYAAGHAAPHGANADLSRAVAASSAFPPYFSPLRARVSPRELHGGSVHPGPARDRDARGLRLADGGVYDNLGLEPIWRDHALLLVSDGGAPFAFAPDRGTWLSQIRRDVAVMANQTTAVRKRWLIASFLAGQMHGAYWGIASAAAHYQPGAPGYSADLAANVIAAIRTDLDAFSPAEAAVLQNHGYSLADAALRSHLSNLLPAPLPPFAWPYPEWRDEAKVRAALAKSWQQTVFGRPTYTPGPPPARAASTQA